MKIALHDSDATTFPNLALMKLSAWHKAQGDKVDWFAPLEPADRVYSSKVFTYTEASGYLPKHTMRGGTGYKDWCVLGDEIEHTCPDYKLTGQNYSMGFLTRGCNNKCKWCFVPDKEGAVRAHADIDEFTRHRDVVLLDNNVLQHKHGLQQIEKIIKKDLRIDFNQGLDASLIDDPIARLLARVKWRPRLRLSCDTHGKMKAVHKAVELLRWHNATPRKYFCYVLVKDIDDALERVQFLKGLSLDPFAQPYRDAEGTEPTKEQRHFARWVNHAAIFNSVLWDDYKPRNSP